MDVKNMTRILLKITYNGKEFDGWQYQHNGRTVQGKIERALKSIHREFIRIHPASRTDKHVHAFEQYAHFDTTLDIIPEKWAFILNNKLSGDVRIIESKEIDSDYHVRYHSKGKVYRYKMYFGDSSPFKYGLETHVKDELNVERMREAAEYFIGTHDFTSFSSAKTVIENKVRHIYKLDIIETTNGLEVVIMGSGFLYNMVRIIVAYLLEVGKGNRDPEATKENINNKDRTQNPKVAPAGGLYLERIFLTEEEQQDYLKENT